MMRKILNFKFLNAEIAPIDANSLLPVFNTAPFEAQVKALLVSTTEIGWELDGPILSSVISFEKEIIDSSDPEKIEIKTYFVKTLSASLTQYRFIGGY